MNEYICDNCGGDFERYPSQVTGENRFCSPDCHSEWMTGKEAPEGHNFRKDGKVEYECEQCGDTNKDYPSSIAQGDLNFCDEDCFHEYQRGRDVGDSHNFYNGGPAIVDCAWCGAELQRRKSKLEIYSKFFCGDSDCEAKYKSANLTGENHPRWNGGHYTEYGSNWSRKRKRALERDGYKCQICGDEKTDLGQHPDVHHIIPLKSFDEPENANYLANLITLCREHHMQVECSAIDCPQPDESIERAVKFATGDGIQAFVEAQQ